MKALKSKESELSKITTQKDKLANEVSNMRTVVDEQKKQRTNLQKKMREDNATFQNEKVKLKFSEVHLIIQNSSGVIILVNLTVNSVSYFPLDSKQAPRVACSAVTQQAGQSATKQREGMEGTAGCDGKTK